MKNKKAKLTAIVILALGLSGLQAQEAIPASGGNSKSSGGSVSYSVGQIVYKTNTGINGSVAQGVQQPYEIFIISGLNEIIQLSISAYPNPTNEILNLNVGDYDKTNLSYQLYDLNGKLLENKKIEKSEIIIQMKNLVPSTYFLKVTNNNKEVKTFKITKN